MLAHVDCDTIPFLWQLADRFTLFDNFHQTTIGPSTPNAIAMIAGQTGETQWALHPETFGLHTQGGGMIPVIDDHGPFPGSTADTSPGAKPAYGADTAPQPPGIRPRPLKAYPPQPPLTFASLPLSFMGPQAGILTRQDENPATDLADVRADIAAVTSRDPAIGWAWYQEGFTSEPNDTTHASYIVHHNGPQYFGYLGDNPAEQAHMHGLADFYADIAAERLPAQGGVFYVRGGYANIDKLQPLDPDPAVRATFAGNDDHPGYADSQISEALVAESINAIAASRYWPQSAIIVTYDETDGLYDHAPEHIRSWGPDGLPLTGGPRVPAIVISPYSAAHMISHVYSEHSSVIKFIDALFGLTPLARLPDERRGRVQGAALFRAPDGTPQENLGPADDFVMMGNLAEAFDNDRLAGKIPPLPPFFAMIHGASTLPHPGCAALGITPTDYRGGRLIDPPPGDFSPRP
jgi:phospholipase C